MKLPLPPVIRCLSTAISMLFSTALSAQFAPPAGQPGTTAMYKDSSAFVGWAATCSIDRGYVNLSDTTITYNGLNKASYGSYLYGSGPADELVVSLGDHGSAILGFDVALKNLPGPDFAVFENSFGDAFLELGFVEASSDGVHFVRFPAISLIQQGSQINTFDTMDATRINNFAGKYRHGYGTPFDLQDLIDSTGIDLSNVRWIRIMDVGGCIVQPYATIDSEGHAVNDPWPTPFDTGGFDLDAVGVIHDATMTVEDRNSFSLVRYFPNPVHDWLTVVCRDPVADLCITTIEGREVMYSQVRGRASFDMSGFPTGIYIGRFILNDGNILTKKIIMY